MSGSRLPIDDVVPSLRAALADNARVVLVAPPGAGKTTRVPLELLEEPWLYGQRIIMLEPRRLAARAAASRLAQSLNERLGQTVGLRARMMTEVSKATRIEVITEGVFTRMVLDDPELTGVGLVIFDEFHERSLDADFGLALALDAQAGLREDLRLLVMSATLDGARIAQKLGADETHVPVIESKGRSFPVETHYVGRDAATPLEQQVVSAVRQALAETDGSVLVFLPGQAEIRRSERALQEALGGDNLTIAPLFGGMDRADQDRAIAPAAEGERKIILATAIAETSLTLDGITAVVDSGLAREPRYDIGARLTRLATVRASRASVDQRRGRAGRLGPGHCYRLWGEPETQSLSPYAVPEVLNSDLSGLLLDCAAWGVTEPDKLVWLDPPPAAGISAASGDLITLGALDADGRITPFGEAVRSLPLPPVLAAMICHAARSGSQLDAARVAALLVERGLGGNATDLDDRLDRFERENSQRARSMRRMAERWAATAEKAMRGTPNAAAAVPVGLDEGSLSTAAVVALAYPDRIARARGAPGPNGTQYLMAGGSGCFLPADDPLTGARFLVVADLQGAARSGRITSAARLDEDELELIAAGRIETAVELMFDKSAGEVRARRQRRLDALVLDSDAVSLPDDPDAIAAALAEGVGDIGVNRLPWSKAQLQWRARVAFLRQAEPNRWPDLSDDALAADLDAWLTPYLAGKSAIRDIGAEDLGNALASLIDYSLSRDLDEAAPTHFTAPTGNRHPISYDGDQAPSISLRVQELFGLKQHPAIANGRLPLTLFLLSPAGRPIQVTRDLPGFWAGSWASVRADLRGRYPKHPWPEDPANAEPTARAKPRGR